MKNGLTLSFSTQPTNLGSLVEPRSGLAGSIDDAKEPGVQPGKSLLKHFAESDLRASGQPEITGPTALTLLSPPEIEDLRTLADEFTRSGDVLVSRRRLARKPHLRIFVLLLQILGAIRVDKTPRDYRLKLNGKLARHLPEILFIYLSESLTLIDNWGSTRVIPEDSLSAIEFIRQFELRRIALTRQAGRDVRPLADRPVAFAVFHAMNEKGEDCYLFEINKDWRRLNFIEGKQEASDRDDFTATVTREISEEIGLAADRISLFRLERRAIERLRTERKRRKSGQLPVHSLRRHGGRATAHQDGEQMAHRTPDQGFSLHPRQPTDGQPRLPGLPPRRLSVTTRPHPGQHHRNSPLPG